MKLAGKPYEVHLLAVIVLIEYPFYRDLQKSWPGIGIGHFLFALVATAGLVLVYLGGEPVAAIAVIRLWRSAACGF